MAEVYDSKRPGSYLILKPIPGEEENSELAEELRLKRQEYILKRRQHYLEWTPEWDAVLIDICYEDFLQQSMRRPYQMSEQALVKAEKVLNENRYCEISRISRRVDLLRKTAIDVRCILSNPAFQWSKETPRMIIAKTDLWYQICTENSSYVTYWGKQIPYYQGKMLEIF